MASFEAVMQDAQDTVMAEYLKASGFQASPAGFDPTIIISIIMMILDICKKPAGELKNAAESPTPLGQRIVKMATRSTLRDEYGLFAYGRYNGDALANGILAAASKAPLEKFQAVVNCCP